MTLPEFRAFASIPRLSRGCVVTEKIDGTNAQIYVPEDGGPLLAASRNQWITDSDPAGFGLWVHEHSDELRDLGPGRHFGEWWGKKIQRNYGLDHRRFSLFNVARWHEDGAEPFITPSANPNEPERTSVAAPSCCYVVPVLWRGVFSTMSVESVLLDLRDNGSKAALGFSKPEGIVVYHEASGHLYKRTLDGDGHKGNRR